MKLHDLRPAGGSRRERTRVGRGIAAGRGKTAGRGTKGEKARTGASVPAWFEGGQTPIHMRVPKLRGFKNRFRTEYAVVNVGRIGAALESGRLDTGPPGAPATVNAELLFAAGLVGRLSRPLKILGGGELSRPILAIADAFSGAARQKIEVAGGTALTLEVPTSAPREAAPREAAPQEVPRHEAAPEEAPRQEVSAPEATPKAASRPRRPARAATSRAETGAPATEPETTIPPADEAKPARRRGRRTTDSTTPTSEETPSDNGAAGALGSDG